MTQLNNNTLLSKIYSKVNNRYTLYLTVFIFSAISFYPKFKYSTNVPYAHDDTRAFLVIFDKQFLNKQKTIPNLMKYLATPSNYPHPRIQQRVFALISYYCTGKIDFRFINILAALGIPLFLFLLVYLKVIDDWITLLSVGFLISLPIISSDFWKVLSVGSYTRLVLPLLIFYFLFKQRLLLAGICSLFVTLSSGAGFTILTTSFLYIIFGIWYFKVLKPKHLLIYSIFIAILGLIFITIFMNIPAVSLEADTMSDYSLFEYLKSKFNAFLYHTVYPIFRYNYQPNIFYLIIGFSFWLSAIVLFFRRLKSVNYFQFISLAFFVFSTKILLIAILARCDDATIIPRYEFFTVQCIIAYVIYVYNFSKDSKWSLYMGLAILLFSSANFTLKINRALKQQVTVSQRLNVRYFKTLLENEQKYVPEKFQLYVNRNLYSPSDKWFDNGENIEQRSVAQLGKLNGKHSMKILQYRLDDNFVYIKAQANKKTDDLYVAIQYKNKKRVHLVPLYKSEYLLENKKNLIGFFKVLKIPKPNLKKEDLSLKICTQSNNDKYLCK